MAFPAIMLRWYFLPNTFANHACDSTGSKNKRVGGAVRTQTRPPRNPSPSHRCLLPSAIIFAVSRPLACKTAVRVEVFMKGQVSSITTNLASPTREPTICLRDLIGGSVGIGGDGEQVGKCGESDLWKFAGKMQGNADPTPRTDGRI